MDWKQAADELSSVEELSELHSFSNLFQALYRLQSEWRSRPGPWIETARETPADRGIDEIFDVLAINACDNVVVAQAGFVKRLGRFPYWMPIPPLPEPRPEPTKMPELSPHEVEQLLNIALHEPVEAGDLISKDHARSLYDKGLVDTKCGDRRATDKGRDWLLQAGLCKMSDFPRPEPTREQLLERVKDEYRKTHTGGCRIYSQGNGCGCFLCRVDCMIEAERGRG